MKKTTTFLILLLFSPLALAFGPSGHTLIAQIAFDNLTPQAKKQVEKLTQLLVAEYPSMPNFARAATWPDVIRGNGVQAYNSWHYVNIPYNPQHRHTEYVRRENIQWALEQSEQILKSPTAKPIQKAIFLRFFSHLVGDIHQPLHTTTLYNRRFPKGDQGGNLYKIRTKYAKNLHALWDQGVGLFYSFHKRFPWTQPQLQRIAHKVEQRYPKSTFGRQIRDTNFWDWASESHRLAVQYAYKIKYNAKPSRQYLAKGREISERQVALAGYRLAYILNRIF